ncbi:hypothetical protein [Oleidesulfovibrio sp.]|uniref:DUF4376 domain-containing protein n=1 Tax=Oleidesulfovibrio sp. TaxID=2909707 RepID=UPI003A8A201C
MPRIETGENPKTGLTGLESQKKLKLAAIDDETSAAILAGFDYAVQDEMYHFSYDSFDQGNFTDAASAATLATMMQQDQSVTWNAYRANGELVRLDLNVADFLGLFTNGALAHKSAMMEQGGIRKAAVMAATTAEEVDRA